MIPSIVRHLLVFCPITVRPSKRIRNGRETDVWEIVAGHHRVEAARKLGWNTIEGFVHDGDARTARMWAIAENLHRAELTALERAQETAEYVRLAGEQVKAQVEPLSQNGRPEGGRETAGATCAGSLSDGRRAGHQHKPSGINAAVRALGIDRTEAQRAIKIDSLSPEAKEAAKETGMDKRQSALLAAAKAPADRQVEAIRSYEPARGKPGMARGTLSGEGRQNPDPPAEIYLRLPDGSTARIAMVEGHNTGLAGSGSSQEPGGYRVVFVVEAEDRA